MESRFGAPLVCIFIATFLVAACQGTPQLGRGGSMISGSSGAAGSQNESKSLVHCDRPLGTAALVEPDSSSVLLLDSVGLQSPTPLLRLLMSQSNCFRVVDRGAALGNILTEQQLKQSGMLQSGATTARGRMVTVQYLLTPNVVFSDSDAGGLAGLGVLGGFFGAGGSLIGSVLGSMQIKEAQTALFLTDAQTGEQTAFSEGAAKVTDFGGGGGLGGFGGGIIGFGGVAGYGSTAEGKLIAAAYLDAFNKLVVQVRATTPNLPTVTGERAVPTAEAPKWVARGSFIPVTRINIRDAPSPSGLIVGIATPEMILVTVGDERNGWWLVNTGNVTGWVYARDLRPAS